MSLRISILLSLPLMVCGCSDLIDTECGPNHDICPRGSHCDEGSCRACDLPGSWISLEAGRYLAGSPGTELGRIGNESLRHIILTHDLLIQTTEVTQQDFEVVLGYNPAFFVNCGADCPVEGVSWNEAAAYCNALSQCEGYEQCYQCTGRGPSVRCRENNLFDSPYRCPGYRLPTEAEWEYAARAGSRSATYHGELEAGRFVCQQPYSTLDPIAWFCGNSGDMTHAAAALNPNEWGLYDTLGNVWEWCHDGFADLRPGISTDPMTASTGTRVFRGGSWRMSARLTRFASRGSYESTYISPDLGFRPVRTLTVDDPPADQPEPGGVFDWESEAETRPAWMCGCSTPPSCTSPSRVAFSVWNRWEDSLTRQVLQGIACARSTLDISIYNIEWSCLTDALAAAKTVNPDLRLRLLVEADNCDQECLNQLEDLGADQVVLVTSYPMHHKLMIIDGQAAIVSSANWTQDGFCGEFNAGVLIDDPFIVSALIGEFERLSRGNYGATVSGQLEPFLSDGIELYFSPQGGDWQREVITRIDAVTARGSVRFMVNAFTHCEIADALVTAHDRGAMVRGIVSTSFEHWGAVQTMLANDVVVLSGDVHHRSLLIDDGNGHLTLVTGTANLSGNAWENYEIVLFINGLTEYTEPFEQEFETIWNDHSGAVLPNDNRCAP